MENVHIRSAKNGFIVEISPYGDDDLVYLYKTVEELKEALPKHIDEALAIKEAEKAKEAATAAK